MGSPCKRVKGPRLNYVQFFCRASRVVTERLCENFLKLRKYIAQTKAGARAGARNSAQNSASPGIIAALTDKNFAEEMGAYIVRIRRHGSRADAHTLAVTVFSWEKTGGLSSEEELSTLRIVDNMHENHLYYLKSTHAALEFGRSQRAGGDGTRKAEAAVSAAEAAVPAAPAAAPAAAPEAPRAAPPVPAAVLAPCAAPCAAPMTMQQHRNLLRARYVSAHASTYASTYVPQLAEIDADVLRGLDASVLLSPRRWEWASDIEACFA